MDANRQQGVLRLDYNITDNTRTYVRLAATRSRPRTRAASGGSQATSRCPRPIRGTSLARSAVANVTSVLSPTATGEVTLLVQRAQARQRLGRSVEVQLGRPRARTIANPFGNSAYIPDVVMNCGSEASMWAARDVDNIFRHNGFARATDNFTKVLQHARGEDRQRHRRAPVQASRTSSTRTTYQLVFAPWGNGSDRERVRATSWWPARPAGPRSGQPSAVGHFVAWNYRVLRAGLLEGQQELHAGVRPAHRQVDEQQRDQRPGRDLRPLRYSPNRGDVSSMPQKRQLNGVAYASRSAATSLIPGRC